MKNLRKGDKVAIISLSSGLLGEKSIDKQRKIGIKNIKNIGRVKSRCVKKIAIGITPVAFLNLFFPNSTS